MRKRISFRKSCLVVLCALINRIIPNRKIGYYDIRRRNQQFLQAVRVGVMDFFRKSQQGSAVGRNTDQQIIIVNCFCSHFISPAGQMRHDDIQKISCSCSQIRNMQFFCFIFFYFSDKICDQIGDRVWCHLMIHLELVFFCCLDESQLDALADNFLIQCIQIHLFVEAVQAFNCLD